MWQIISTAFMLSLSEVHFVFPIIYGAILGFISGRMAELRVFAKLKATAASSLS
jgi:hypothetical protein